MKTSALQILSTTTALLLGLLATPARADILYATLSGGVLKFNSNGAASSFGFGWNRPTGLVFDKAGNLYVADNNTILKFTPAGGGSVFASSGLNVPVGLAFDSAGNLFAANAGSNTIVKFAPNGSSSVFASGLSGAKSLAFDNVGNLFISSGGNTILKFTPDGVSSVFANSGLSVPYGLAFDSAGNLYVANPGNNTIVKLTPGGVGSVFASGSPATGGLLDNTFGLAFDHAGNLYAANSTNGTKIVKFSPGGVGAVFASGLNFPSFLAFTDDSGTPLTLPPKPPALRIVQTAPGSFQVRWPSSASHWTLETRSNLSSDSWVPIPGPYSTESSDCIYNLQPAEPSRFFHLRP